MFRAVKVHHQEVSCRIKALWYNIMSKYIWYIYGIVVNHQLVLYVG